MTQTTSNLIQSARGWDLWQTSEGWAVYSEDGDLLIADVPEAHAREMFRLATS